MRVTLTLAGRDSLSNEEKCTIVRSVVNTLYMQGFGVVVITFPDGDTNDCDAPVSDRHPYAHPRADFYPTPGTFRDDDGHVRPLSEKP